MVIKDRIIEHLQSNDGKVYLYISKNKLTLDSIRQLSNEGIDFSKTKTKVVLVHPEGMGFIKGNIDVIYYDSNTMTEDFISNKIELNNNIEFKEVNEITQEINN